MYLLQAFDELFEVVPCNRLLQPTCLRQNDKEVCLIGWEYKVSAVVALELDITNVVAGDYIIMLHILKHLTLVGSLVYLSLLLLIQLNQYSSILAI